MNLWSGIAPYEINAWVYERTEGLIDSIIDEFCEYDVMLLINALYFKGQWEETMSLRPSVFYTAAGESINMDFLSTTQCTFYVTTNPYYEAARIDYECGQFGFLAVRPTGGTTVREFAASYNFAETIANLQPTGDVIISMPGLNLEYEITMNNVLQNMGLNSAFNGLEANFSGLINENEPLYISDVLQKVRIIVDEFGTEAAAVTAIRMRMLSGVLTPPTILSFDSPYLYFIYHIETGIPLFMGVVDNFS